MRIDVGGKRGKACHLRALLQFQQVADRLGFIGAPATEDFVEHQAERVNVALGGDLVTAQLLRRHVGGCAVARFRTGQLIGHGGEAEVHDDGLATLVQHNVLRLEVAVDDPFIMRRGEPRTDLASGIERLIRRQASNALEQVGEVFTIDVLHGNERLAVHFADVVHAADIWMRDLACDADFSVEPLQHAFGDTRFGQELECHYLRKREVGGAIDFAHAAAAE